MYCTIYTRTIKRRKTKKTETVGCVYRTKSLTSMHAHIRKEHADAQTWENPREVITDFIAGLNLGVLPIICGGVRVA